MAGKRGRSGRKPQPATVKLAKGTWANYRDGEAEAVPMGDGVPERPQFTNPHAEQCWDEYVPQLIAMGVAKAVDAPMLQSMCELWGLYRASYSMAETDPTDKDARIAVVAYWAKFEQAAARFGMNASDRGRLKIDKPNEGGIAARKRG